MTREELKGAIMGDAYLVQTNRYRKLEDENGTQRLLDRSEFESEQGRVVQIYLYEGDTTNWRVVSIDECVYDVGGNEVIEETGEVI